MEMSESDRIPLCSLCARANSKIEKNRREERDKEIVIYIHVKDIKKGPTLSRNVRKDICGNS